MLLMNRPFPLKLFCVVNKQPLFNWNYFVLLINSEISTRNILILKEQPHFQRHYFALFILYLQSKMSVSKRISFALLMNNPFQLGIFLLFMNIPISIDTILHCLLAIPFHSTLLSIVNEQLHFTRNMLK